MVITRAWKRRPGCEASSGPWFVRSGTPLVCCQREGSLAAGPGSDHHTTIDEDAQPLEDCVVIEAARRRDLPAGRRAAGLLKRGDGLVDEEIRVGEVLRVNRWLHVACATPAWGCYSASGQFAGTDFSRPRRAGLTSPRLEQSIGTGPGNAGFITICAGRVRSWRSPLDPSGPFSASRRPG